MAPSVWFPALYPTCCRHWDLLVRFHGQTRSCANHLEVYLHTSGLVIVGDSVAVQKESVHCGGVRIRQNRAVDERSGYVYEVGEQI
jgi:hypothetical protein